MEDTIDVLLASYNGEEYIDEQILSLEEQTLNHFDILISDDASTDSTIKHIHEYQLRYANIHLLENHPHFGDARRNFLFLAHQSQAQYAMFCDQDDYWLPSKVELTYQKMKLLEEQYGVETPLLVFTDMRVVDSSLRSIDDSFESYSNIDPNRTDFKQVISQSLGAGCTMMVNRKLLNVLKKTPPDQFMIMHDWWMTLIAAAFGHIGYVAQSTSLYRQHEDNSVGARRFSILKTASVPQRMVTSFRLTVQQASSFREIYGHKLTHEKLECLNAFSSIEQKSILPRLFALFKSGSWKKGTRKIGQVFAVITFRLYG